MLRVLSVLLLLIVSFPFQAFAFDHGFALWNKDLARFDDGGYIHYGQWQRHRDRLDRFLAGMRATSPQQMIKWSAAEREAFWINAYNALVVANILRVYPALNKLEDRSYKIAGQQLTATYIRDEILRGSETKVLVLSNLLGANTTIAKGRDMRILFALCDGTRATPLLAAKAYTARHLSAQLDAQVKRTVANPHFVRIDTRLRIFHLGNFFLVYQDDFRTYRGNAMLFTKSDASNRGVLRFVFPYLDKPVQDKISAKQNRPWQVNYHFSSQDLNGGN